MRIRKRPRKLTITSKWLSVEVRINKGGRRTGPNPIPPDDERCTAATAKGTRCTRSRERWSDQQRCFQHLRPTPNPRPLEAVPETGGDLLDDPAEWLASLGQDE